MEINSAPTGLFLSATCTGGLWVPENKSQSSHGNWPSSHCASQLESFSACSCLHFHYLGYENVKQLILVEVI